MRKPAPNFVLSVAAFLNERDEASGSSGGRDADPENDAMAAAREPMRKSASNFLLSMVAFLDEFHEAFGLPRGRGEGSATKAAER